MPVRGEGMCEVKEEKETENCSQLSLIGKYEPKYVENRNEREREREREREDSSKLKTKNVP